MDDGILIEGNGSFSIDQQRYNFQFGGDAFWEIKGGKKRGMISRVAYQSRTPDFWHACDGIAGPSLLAAIRSPKRWQRRTAANQRRKPWLLALALSADQRTADRLRNEPCSASRT